MTPIENSLPAAFVRILALALLVAGLSSGSPVIIPTGVDWSRGGTVWLKEDNTDVQAYFAGVIYIQVVDSPNVYNRDSFCVDLFTDIFLSRQYSTTVLRPDQVPDKHLTRVSWLVDNALLPTQNNTYTSVLPQLDWVVSAAQGAGLQLAIWDIVHDNGDGFSAGRVQAVFDAAHPGDPAYGTDPAILAWAQQYEALSLNQSSDLGFIYDNISLSDGTPAQMLAGPLFTDGGPAPTPNPEPVTYLLVGGALVGLGCQSRRNSRR